jgi:phosphomannomutase/phosphoglucomutase
MASLKATMFREYDIRGLVQEGEFSEVNCFILGQGFGTWLAKKKVKTIVVGYDAREYSERLKNALVKGLLSTGLKVVEIGLVLVPLAYFAQHLLKIKGVAMLTASHNPNGWSGLKFGYDYETTLGPQEIQELQKIILKGKFVKGQGCLEFYKNIVADYQNYIVKKVKLARPLKVVINAGNGTAGPIVPSIFRAVGCEVVEQFTNIDFNFPHHEPNPSSLEALGALAKEVLATKADLGVGIDGDGDRLGVIDEKGAVIWPDRFLILLARQVLKAKPGAKIVFDVKSSQALAEEIIKAGGVPIMWKTGHSYIKQKAKEEEAALAGERSGHIFYFHDYFGYDDAIFAALKLFEYLSKTNQPLSQIMLSTPQYFLSPAWHVDCPDEVKYKIVEQLTKDLKKEFGKDKVIAINGARVTFPEGWGLVRASSNLPALELVVEAKTEAGLQRIEKIFRDKLAEYKEVTSHWFTG